MNDWQFGWVHDRFRETLALWLERLPAQGWTGTIFELQIALNRAAHRRRATRYSRRPSGPALGVRIRAERAFLLAKGFELKSLRTAKQRGIRIAPLGLKE